MVGQTWSVFNWLSRTPDLEVPHSQRPIDYANQFRPFLPSFIATGPCFWTADDAGIYASDENWSADGWRQCPEAFQGTPGGGGGGGKRIKRWKKYRHIDCILEDVTAQVVYNKLRKTPDRVLAANVVREYAATNAQVPQAKSIDWAAVSRDAAVVGQLLALWCEREIEDDDSDAYFLGLI